MLTAKPETGKRDVTMKNRPKKGLERDASGLAALGALLEDLSLISRTHIVAHNPL